MNENEKGLILKGLQALQYDLEMAQKDAATLIANIAWDHDNEIKRDKDGSKQSMCKDTVNLFTKISDLTKNQLDDIQRSYKWANKEPEEPNPDEEIPW